MERVLPRLELVTNWAILATAVFCVGVWTKTVLLRPAAPSDGSAYYAPGEVFPTIDGLDVSKAPTTLVFVVSSTCRFCTESMPFYQSIVHERDRAESPTQLVVLGQEDQKTLGEYLSGHGVRPDAVVSVMGVQGVKANRTPTILQLDSRGVVVRAWYGRLSRSAEQSVLDLVVAESHS